MSVGQHPLMQDARNQNTTGLLTVENHVFATSGGLLGPF
jgi:hypothetical protein